MLSRSNFLNPDRSNITLYAPVGNAGNKYRPSASVFVVRLPIKAGDVTVTVTPGITAPCASVTMPVSRPCVICACAGAATNATIRNTSSGADLILIEALPQLNGDRFRGRYYQR